MHKLFLIFTLVLLVSGIGYSQTTPPDYYNTNVKNGQRSTTDTFIKYLEHGKIDSVLKLIDTSFLKSKYKYRDSLIAYNKELSKYLKTTKLSIMLVYLENQYNTYRCRYYNEKGELFFIDLYYNIKQPNSPIAKIWKKSRKEIEQDKKEMIKRLKEMEKTGRPTPPKSPTHD